MEVCGGGVPCVPNILPRTSFPTGALIESPESVTGVFLAKPKSDRSHVVV